MKCVKGNEISVHKTPAGYYIGCFDDEGPVCRISRYYNKKEQADKALERNTFYPDEGCVLCPGVWDCVHAEADNDDGTVHPEEIMQDNEIFCDTDGDKIIDTNDPIWDGMGIIRADLLPASKVHCAKFYREPLIDAIAELKKVLDSIKYKDVGKTCNEASKFVKEMAKMNVTIDAYKE